MQDDPFLDEPEALAEPEAAPGPDAQPEGQADGEAASAEAETVESDIAAGAESAAPAANPATSAVKVKTRVEVDFTAEPYAAGQCHLMVGLTFRPNPDRHPDGRIVLVGVRSHDEAPLFGLVRERQLTPATVFDLVGQYEASLPARGAKKAQRQAEAEAKHKADEERRKTSRARTTTARKVEPAKPATAAKPASKQEALFGA